ncbi:MAG: hypothetical protein Q7T79_02545 [bacterium]|nr:hypothetical protein [bacterium]
MPLFNYQQKNKKIILALGAESTGNFSVYFSEKIYFSEDFGDLLDEKNFKNFQKSVLNFLEKNRIKPDIILTDLHPLYKTTLWGEKLAKKFKAKHIKIQHHIAHIFSSIGEYAISNFNLQAKKLKSYKLIGIACDGTGYGLDRKIWGGEIFSISNFQFPIFNKIPNSKFKIERIGHLENQIMIGGDLAIKEPARMLIAILAKIPNLKFHPEGDQPLAGKSQKDFIYKYVKKFYARNQFELLYCQLQQNFNCIETSSTGRILDAVSILLGFCKNERNYKHEPIDLLEKNSSKPYADIKPKIGINYELRITNYELLTTHLFEYLINNIHRDKKRLAATAQLYIAQGLYQITKKLQAKKLQAVFFAGGIANNKIISNYLKSKGVIVSEKIPRGDAGLSFGQIIYFLTNSWD